MKFRNIFWGVILVFIGVLFLLQNFNVIHFEWLSLWRLWPVILILWGVSILPANNWIKTGLVLVVLAGTLYFMIDQAVKWDSNDNTEFESWNNEDQQDADQDFSLPFEDSIPMAELSLDAAAGKFEISQPTNNLVDFQTRGGNVTYNYNITTTDSLTSVRIEREGVDIKHNNGSHQVLLELNQIPTWKLDFEVGASAMNLDLTPFKISNLTIDGGAASFDIKLGNANPDMNVNINAGASSIKILVPQSSGCDLRISSVLSEKTIEGFEKIDHGHFQTEDFDKAENKINLNIEAAVSSFSIVRY